jgi:FtsH-binding integral membrane protein
MRYLLLVALVGLFIGALLLSIAFRLVTGRMPSYPRALAVTLGTWLVVGVALLALREWSGGGRGLSIALQGLFGTGMVQWLLPSPAGPRLGLGRSALVQLVFILLQVVAGAVLAMLVTVVFGIRLPLPHTG